VTQTDLTSPPPASASASPPGTEQSPSSSTPNVAGVAALVGRGEPTPTGLSDLLAVYRATDLAGIYRSHRSRHTVDRLGRLRATWTALDAFRAARRALVRATAPRKPLGYASILYSATPEYREQHARDVAAWFAWAEAHVDALTGEERDYVASVLEARRVMAERGMAVAA
jgi:hypothetical protein